MTCRSLLLVALLGALAGCKETTDLGTPCILVGKDPNNPDASVPLKEGSIKPNRDYISFGALECDDKVCVRDSTFSRPEGATDDSDAIGYCSRQCVQNSTIGCPAADPADDNNAARRLSCRALILDETTLAAIRQADPETFRRYFGDTESPYFCARGGAADAGT